jgi:hypothetical protein
MTGLILRYESRHGLVSNPELSEAKIETYDYDSDIKIEPPIR